MQSNCPTPKGVGFQEISVLKRELEIRNFSARTVKSYVYHVEKFLMYAEKRGLNENIVKDYIQEQIKIKNPSTVAHSIFAISFFFDKILNQKINIPRPKRNKTMPEVLISEEIKKLIESTNNIKHKLIIKLLYGCGLRVSEIINIKKEDVNFDEGLIHIKLSKSKRDRFVKIPESIKEELKSYCNILNEEILFPSNRGGKLTTATIQAIVENSAKKQELKKEFILTY